MIAPPLPRTTGPGTADHILTYARNLQGGGVERAMLRLARGWIAEGRRVTLVAGSLEGALAVELPAGIETVVLNDDRYAALFALAGIVRATAPDILFCPGNHYTSIAAVTRLRLGRHCPPIVAKMSNAPNRADHGRLMDAGHCAWLALHGRFLDHVVAMTPATEAAAARALHMAGRTSVIPNPPAQPIPGAAMPALPTGDFILGVGRLVPQKRWDRLIAALPHLARNDVSLVLLGEGPLRAELTAQAAGLGLARRVSMPGHAVDPMPAMERARVLALTSDFEGVPGVLRESLSMGTPVVSTDSSVSVAEIVADPALGTIVPRDDRQKLVAALDRWLAPDAVMPTPVPQPGSDSAARYLALFDRIVAERR